MEIWKATLNKKFKYFTPQLERAFMSQWRPRTAKGKKKNSNSRTETDKMIDRHVDKVIEQSVDWTWERKDKIMLGVKARL